MSKDFGNWFFLSATNEVCFPCCFLLEKSCVVRGRKDYSWKTLQRMCNTKYHHGWNTINCIYLSKQKIFFCTIRMVLSWEMPHIKSSPKNKMCFNGSWCVVTPSTESLTQHPSLNKNTITQRFNKSTLIFTTPGK